MNWQPIDTAPRDGTRVLLRFERSEEVVVGGYDVHIRIRNGIEVSRSEGWCLGEHRSGQPACWAPLPVSPVAHDQVENALIHRLTHEEAMDDFAQMTPEQKRAWALGQAISKATLDEEPGATVERAKAFFAYVFISSQDVKPQSAPPLREAS